MKNYGIPIREKARRTGISRNAIKKYLGRLVATLGEEGEALSNKQLADKAYDNEALLAASSRLEALMKHFGYAQTEIGKTGVTRQLLWLEYRKQHTSGYSYSQYCHYFNIYVKDKDVAIHLEYDAGDMIMIDFAGKKLRYVHADSGEVVECDVFISILPYSGLIFCRAVVLTGFLLFGAYVI